MSTADTAASSEHLQQLWEQGSRHIAQSFLRRVLHSDMTLMELSKALEFQKITPHLKELRLQDVLGIRHDAGASTLASHARSAPSAARPKVQARRKRRGPEELQAIRDAVTTRLSSAVGGVTSTHLCMMLQKEGFDVDLLHLGRILNQMEEDGAIANLGGKPRSWRLKPQGRRAPEPMVIRKAAVLDAGTAAS